MKIGVVTFWYGNSNYGMILQCWALQQYLKKLGHEPFVIRFVPKGSPLRRFVKKSINVILSIFDRSKRNEYKQICKQQKQNIKRDKLRKFEDFRRFHFSFSEYEYKHLSELKKNPPKADCYITGSDQVWCSVAKSDDSLGFFLCFGDNSVKRIAYAPSIGKLEYPPKVMALFSSVLQNFDAISCREYSSIVLCKQAGYNAEKVEDPTLLLDVSDYLPLCEKVKYNKDIFIYSVNMRNSDDIYWNEIKDIFGLENIIVTPASGNSSGTEIFGNDVLYYYATPGEWLSLIINSNLVITSSFHGVVFSILFNKKFAYVPVKGEYSIGNNRVTDLLNSMNLDYLIINSPEDYRRICDLEIKWNDINKRRNELIVKSKAFLLKSLI